MGELGSIADLKIVVDAQTEKLKGDLEAARGIVAQFVSEGSKSLSLFDSAIAKVGDTSELVKGKIEKLQSAADLAAKRMVPALGQIGALAARLGVEKEWDDLTAAVGEFGVAVGKAGSESFTGLIEKIKSSGVESLKAKDSTTALSGALASNTLSADSGARAIGGVAQSVAAHAVTAQAAATATETLTRANNAAATQSTEADARTQAFSRNLMGLRDAAGEATKHVSATAVGLDTTAPAAQTAGDNIAGAGERLREFAEKAREAAAGAVAGKRLMDEQGEVAKGFLAWGIEGQTEKVRSATIAIVGLQKGLEGLTEQQIQTRIAAVSKDIGEIGAQLRIGNEPGFLDRLLGNDALAQANLLSNLRLHLENLRKELETRIAGGGWAAELVWADMERFVEGLEKANEKLRDEAELAGLSRGAAAERKIMLAAEREAARQDLAIAAEKKASIKELAAENRRLVESAEARRIDDNLAHEEERRREHDHKAVDKIDESIAREFEQLQAKARALTMNADAATQATFAEKLFAEARRAGLDLAPADVASINETAAAYAALARSVKELERAQQAMQATTAVFSNAISSEFATWTRSGEFNVRRMVSNMLAELAKLTLARGVLGPLFGGSGTDGAGLIGDMLKGLVSSAAPGVVGAGGWGATVTYGGAFAGGGQTEPGKAYLVGEQGPELWYPDRAGFVMPSNETRETLQSAQRAGGGNSVSLSVSIPTDARGATVDAVARLEQLKAELPGIIMGTMQDAQARGMA